MDRHHMTRRSFLRQLSMGAGAAVLGNIHAPVCAGVSGW